MPSGVFATCHPGSSLNYYHEEKPAPIFSSMSCHNKVRETDDELSASRRVGQDILAFDADVVLARYHATRAIFDYGLFRLVPGDSCRRRQCALRRLGNITFRCRLRQAASGHFEGATANYFRHFLGYVIISTCRLFASFSTGQATIALYKSQGFPFSPMMRRITPPFSR